MKEIIKKEISKLFIILAALGLLIICLTIGPRRSHYYHK